MYPLKQKIFVFIIIFSGYFFYSCKPHSPLSPEEAFKALKKAYCEKDAKQIVDLLSAGSKNKINSFARLISSMDDSQLKALADRFGANMESLRDLDAQGYISLQLAVGKKVGEDVVDEIMKYEITGIDIKDERAAIRVDNKMEIYFIKEGPYWKFDMGELSGD